MIPVKLNNGETDGGKLRESNMCSFQDMCRLNKQILVLGMVIQPLIGNPYNGYINPYYWVDDHPRLYGNNGSLDPSTYNTSRKFNSEFTPEKWCFGKNDPASYWVSVTFQGVFAVKLREGNLFA